MDVFSAIWHLRLLGWSDVSDHQLDRIVAVDMSGLLYRIADIYGLMGMNVLEIWRHIECYSIQNPARAIVFQFQFYVFHIFPHKSACAEVKNIFGTEYRILVARTEWIEFFQ